MPKERSPWFPFYADDYIGGTRGMSLAAKGAFVDLICYQFANGSIPSDDRKICRIIGAFPDEWEEIRAEVMPKFEADDDGNLINARVAKEIQNRKTRSENGKKGGRGNRKESQSKAKPKAESKLNGKLNQSPTTTTISTVRDSLPREEVEEFAPSDPTLEQVKQAARNMMIREDIAELFFEDMEAVGWLDRHSRHIKNFQHALKAWATRYEDNEARRNTAGGTRQNGNRVNRNAGNTNDGRASEYADV